MSRNNTEFMIIYRKCVKIVGYSGKEAYDLAERRYKKLYGNRYYKNVNSFKSAASRKYKNR